MEKAPPTHKKHIALFLYIVYLSAELVNIGSVEHFLSALPLMKW